VPFAIPMLLTLIFCYSISVIVFCFFSEYTNSISRKIIIFTFCLLNFPFFIICPFIISAYWDLREVIIIAGTFLMVLLYVGGIFCKSASIENIFEAKYASLAWKCRKKRQPFLIDSINIPSRWKYYLLLFAVKLCGTIMLIFPITIMCIIIIWDGDIFNHPLSSSIIILSTGVLIFSSVSAAVVRRLLKREPFRMSEFFINNMKLVLFTAAMFFSIFVFDYYYEKYLEIETRYYDVEYNFLKISKRNITELKTSEKNKHILKINISETDKIVKLELRGVRRSVALKSVKAAVGEANVPFKIHTPERYTCGHPDIVIEFFTGDLNGTLEIELTFPDWVKHFKKDPYAV
jgi:hypothetical protein